MFRRIWMRPQIFILAGIGVGLSLMGFNCARVNLEGIQDDSVYQSLAAPFDFKKSYQEQAERRFIFVVDMSNSMIKAPCPGDLEASSSAADIQTQVHACYSNQSGNDSQYFRLAAVKKMITDYQQNLTEEDDLRTKVMILPFSGGRIDAVNYAGNKYTRWIPISQASKVLDELAQIQAQEVQDAIQVGLVNAQIDTEYKKRMGTSIPYLGLNRAFNGMYEELKLLRNQGRLFSAVFSIHLFTDGMMTPIQEHMDRVKQKFQVVCQQGSATAPFGCESSSDKDKIADETEQTPSWLTMAMKNEWGDPSDNSETKLQDLVKRIIALQIFYQEASVKFHAIQLNSDKLGSQSTDKKYNIFPLLGMVLPNETTPRWNLLYAKNDEVLSSDVKKWISVPALEGAPSQLSTIKMTDFFAVNLNARLDRNGKLAADSDGDGLSDQEELELSQKLGLQIRPDQARSNGICLDVMMVNPAYTQACLQAQATNVCDPNIDMDGDGLSQCEEMILGTSDLKFDTDEDGIPDSFEILFGYNPKAAEKKQSQSANGVSDSAQFMMGLPAGVDLNKALDGLRVHLTKQFLGYTETKEASQINPSRMIYRRVESYKVQMQSAPLVVATYAAEENKNMRYTSESLASSVILTKNKLIHRPHGVGVNTFLFLARAIDASKPHEPFWYMKSIDVVVPEHKGTDVYDQGFQFSDLDILRVMDSHK